MAHDHGEKIHTCTPCGYWHMAKAIVKQPNGKYCIFSSVVDNITVYDMTKEEIIDDFLEEHRIRITEKVNLLVDRIDRGVRDPGAMSYEEALDSIKKIHGIEEFNVVKSLIEND